MITFEQAFDRLIGAEGGYTSNPSDPGGETNWGISKRSYPNIDIRSLTRDDAKIIYRRDFWDALGTADPAVKFQVFDFAVNSGISTAIRKLQVSVGVADDGHWGPISANALSAADRNDVLMRFNAERLKYYTLLSTWPSFGKGWVNRVAQNLIYATQDN